LAIYPKEYDNTEKPFYLKKDGSLFIYPTPTADVTD
jgi:hypothetical protein